MQLSVLTDEIDARLGRALDVCEELGIDAVELRTVDGVQVVDHAPDAVRAMRQDLDDRGFRVTAVASPFLKCDRGEEQEEVHERALVRRSSCPRRSCARSRTGASPILLRLYRSSARHCVAPRRVRVRSA